MHSKIFRKTFPPFQGFLYDLLCYYLRSTHYLKLINNLYYTILSKKINIFHF